MPTETLIRRIFDSYRQKDRHQLMQKTTRELFHDGFMAALHYLKPAGFINTDPSFAGPLLTENRLSHKDKIVYTLPEGITKNA